MLQLCIARTITSEVIILLVCNFPIARVLVILDFGTNLEEDIGNFKSCASIAPVDFTSLARDAFLLSRYMITNLARYLVSRTIWQV